MKKYIILFAAIVFAASTINAQLKVDSIGRIRLNNKVALGSSTNFDANSGLQTTKNISQGTYYGLYSKINTSTGLYNNTFLTSIYGQVAVPNSKQESNNKGVSLNRFVAAVAGVAKGGIGIYGKTGTGLPTTNLYPVYAGYFDGNVYVNGTLTTSSSTTSSDARLKSNINKINSNQSTQIFNLNPVSYLFSPDSIHLYYDSDAQELKKTHFGFIAQEVSEIFPNLVYENESDGYLSINYIEMIPLLVASIKELKQEIVDLKSKEENKVIKKIVESSVVAKLYQNNPNPFNQSTEIRYELPLETNNANLYIYDMNGTQIAAYNLTEFGSGSITITAGELNAGMYLYSLIADGQLVDTKQMILTK